jgi:tetratricopeptide (TPR) repeat protein
MRPLCFVLMPFGRKTDAAGNVVDFDAVYRDLIAPAITESGLDPLRADHEEVGGVIQKPMFERLVLCEYAVADLTTANANVYYELGVRHAVRPYSTVLLYANTSRLPFDVGPLRYVPYELGSGGTVGALESSRAALVEGLRAAQRAQTDSPLFQLLDGYPVPALDRLKTDVFREQVEYSVTMKRRLADARGDAANAFQKLSGIEHDLGDLGSVEAGVVVDLLLSYRAVGTRGGWESMVELVGRMPAPIATSALVQEQLGFAFNRLGRRDEAEDTLRRVIETRGPSSETCGLLGRVYKDRMEDALAKGANAEARGHLDRAIATYLQGFEADWRDAYPGINAVTLMEIREQPDERRHGLLPVVRYSAQRRLASGLADYWDYATLLEADVLALDEAAAQQALGDALAMMREGWEASSTADNLGRIRRSREARGNSPAWAKGIEDSLRAAAT